MRNKILLMAALVMPLAAYAAKGGARMEQFFTPEQRVLFMEQARDQVKDMSPDERKTFRRDQIAKLMGMSDTEKAKLKADLQAKWDALPQARKDRIEQRIAMRQDDKQDGKPAAGQTMNPNRGSAVVK